MTPGQIVLFSMFVGIFLVGAALYWKFSSYFGTEEYKDYLLKEMRRNLKT